MSIIVKFILKTNKHTTSTTIAINKAKNKPRPILKKKFGKLTDKAIIKIVRMHVAPKAYEIVITGYDLSTIHNVAPRGKTTMLYPKKLIEGLLDFRVIIIPAIAKTKYATINIMKLLVPLYTKLQIASPHTETKTKLNAKPHKRHKPKIRLYFRRVILPPSPTRDLKIETPKPSDFSIIPPITSCILSLYMRVAI